MENVQVSTRISKEIKEAAQRVYERQGLDISVVIKMLLTKTANEGRIPMTLDDDYYSTSRVAIREEISKLAQERVPLKEVDWDSSEEVKDLLNDW